ncbi:MAG TPA: hypothetical protein VFH44_01570 [Solirubrobacterales bacterium]|nr:hypothetical protein [Solirubrobacterales bacterium]
MRTEARFPSVPARAGHYESFYLKAAAPAGGRAVWIRHTIHKPPGEPPTGAVWMTGFDAAQPRPQAAKDRVGADRISIPAGAYVRIGEAEIAPGRIEGGMTGAADTSWSLRFHDHSGPLDHFPRPWMYERGLPRTKLRSPHPSITVDGRLEVDGERLTLREWPGMIGHNWGAEHAESWIWVHAATVGPDGSRGYVDLGAGKVKLGPLSSPWVLNGEILDRGERLRVGGLHPLRPTRISAEPTRCELRAAAGDGGVVRGSVAAPAERFVGWSYADPAGPGHHALNCSIADLELSVERPGRPPLEIAVAGAATYELGTRRTDHGIPIEPFGDG